MSVWQTLTSNYVINVGVASWFSAQIFKTLFTLLATKKLELERLVGAGGMPSSHSALTASIAIAIERKLGFMSPEFGLALAFAAIVIYDAMGVRRAAGEQAKVLNKMIFEFSYFPFFSPKDNAENEENPPDTEEAEIGQPLEEGSPIIDKELKELLGHTPFEVLGGCLLGILISLLMPVV